MLRAGRWHEQGHRVVYAADSEALAALEAIVHLSSASQVPDYICLKASIPDSFIADVRDFGRLPDDWNQRDSLEARSSGTRWLRSADSVALRVPSVVIPRESNYLLNPSHPRFNEIEISRPLLFEFDARLFGRIQ
jgi:RES domain-containing protein